MMHSIVLDSRRHSPGLVAISALLVAYYGMVWQSVYSLGVPTGVASTLAGALPVLFLGLAVLVGLRYASLADVALFAGLSLGGGIGGALGSIVGNAFGRTGLMAGGVIGGMMMTTAVVLVGYRFGWIVRRQVPLTVVASALGFLAAALVATTTLSSPIGPLASTALIGSAGVWGAWHAAPRDSR